MYAFPLGGRGGDFSAPVVGRYEWVPRPPLPSHFTPPYTTYTKDIAKDPLSRFQTVLREFSFLAHPLRVRILVIFTL